LVLESANAKENNDAKRLPLLQEVNDP